LKHKIVTLVVVLAGLGGLAAFNYYTQQPRTTAAQENDQVEAEHKLQSAMMEEMNAVREVTQAADIEIGTPSDANKDWPEETPDTFRVRFEASNGNFIMEIHKDWAPIGVERFYQLVREGFYDDNRFFRVVPRFVVQFGLNGDPQTNAQWRQANIPDDPVKENNKKGYVSFASAGPNTRTTQLFISIADNERLDDMGFSPIGRVVEGMHIVDDINAEYGERPDQGRIQSMGNRYLLEQFPNMDYIKRAVLISDEADDEEDADEDTSETVDEAIMVTGDAV